MPAMFAYLDDFGKITVWINRNFYGGRSDSFSLLGEGGSAMDLVISGVEDHEGNVRYDLTAPADMKFGTEYYLREIHGLMVPLQFRGIVQTKRFNELFEYDGDDLGAVYHRRHTDFALWAPTASAVSLMVYSRGWTHAYAMARSEKGVWRMSVIGDLKHATYVYLIKRNGKVVESLDPYGLSSTGNSRRSAVIDPEEILKVPSVNVKGKCCGTDAVIYETSVRDITAHPFTGTKEHSTFRALCESGTTFNGMPTGLDYLASLGVTHVQLLPVLDFCTIDEFHPQKNYNWGYDPIQYLSLEGSYSSDPDDPYCRMKEMREMVSAFHKKGLRVNLDVVFNHFYDVDTSCFNCALPYYYFRYNAGGFLTNGSYCGNDFASNQPMARRFLVHSIAKLMELYNVDGFRFDLMGILDVTTMNAIRDEALKHKKDAMIYGEGWDMPTLLGPQEKACIVNQNQMPGIGHFNDYYRDTVKGKTSDDQKYERGYVTGDLNQAFGMLSALSANVLGDPYFYRFDSPEKSINNLETHDNSTVWDKMHACCGNEDRETRKRRQKMMIGSLLVSQGVPFLHAGLEFCGTKNDNPNSYNAGDSINQVDWQRALYNQDVIDYTRKIIAIRKKYKGFRLKSSEEIRNALQMSVADGGVVFYDIHYADPSTRTSILRVIINPSFDDKYYTFEPGWKVIFDSDGNGHEEETDNVMVPGVSMLICKHEDKI
jgi:pullulanase